MPAILNDQLSLSLFSPNPQRDKEPDWDSLSDDDLSELCIIPIGGYPREKQTACMRIWHKANEVAAKRIQKRYVQRFQARGSAQRWFSLWKPKGKALREISDGIEEGLDVIERLYPMIEERGINHSEDMGLLQANCRDNSEGIRIKKEVYGEIILVQICAVTGPTNFDVTSGTIEFEPGSQSHIYMLAYNTLPNKETLEADLCVYPIIRDPSNHYVDKYGKPRTYRSEGFTSARLSAQGLPVHRPWLTLTERQQEELIHRCQP